MESPKLSESASGFEIDGQEFTFVGIPTDAFVNPPSPFGDQKKLKLHFIEKVEHPPEGGFLSYRRYQKFPFKGTVFPEGLMMVNVPKRLLRDGARIAAKTWWLWGWWLLIPYVRRYVLWLFAHEYATYSFHFINRYYVKPDWCCTCVREFYRVSQNIFWDDRLSERERWSIYKILLALGLFLEFDDSYRYRFQDMMGALDKQAFLKSPSKEISRLFAVLKARGQTEIGDDSVATRLQGLVWLARVGFLLFPAFKRKAIQFVREADLKKLALDEGDYYHCMVRPDYNYRGVPFGVRLKERQDIDGENWAKQIDNTYTA